MRPAFGLLQIGYKSENNNDVAFCWHDVIAKSLSCFVSLVKFSYWSKFQINIITGSRVMTIYFHEGLIRNPEIGSNPVWFLLNIWRLGRVRDTKLSMYVSNKILLNSTKCQGHSFYYFWVIKGKLIWEGQGIGSKITPHPYPD